MDIDLRDLHHALHPPVEAPQARWRQATIVAVNAGPPPTVDLHEAGSTVTIPAVRYADSITSPTIGDTIWLLERGGDRIVAFRLAN